MNERDRIANRVFASLLVMLDLAWRLTRLFVSGLVVLPAVVLLLVFFPNIVQAPHNFHEFFQFMSGGYTDYLRLFPVVEMGYGFWFGVKRMKGLFHDYVGLLSDLF